ncbi:MAG: LysM peptidoglycan-binding domain-containing protein [Anaerolineae bacterium]|nr:LysM peptidoglycan-binding domain-containing protein [Anaerolineae bacterium]
MRKFIARRGARRCAPTSRLFVIGIITLLASACSLQATHPQSVPILLQGAATATETIPPSTPLPSLTPSRTLLPPPTFEPPTLTPLPSATPTVTLTSTLDLSVSIPGLHGLETATPTGEAACEPRKDWKLTYTVQPNDALAHIAERYGTYVSTLAEANCLDDPNVISIGQVLRVPGDAPPSGETYDCSWTLLIPQDGTLAVSGSGTLTFTWRGPRAARNLIRLYKPNGGTYEVVVELRQNETIDLSEIPDAGTYTWYVYPLDGNFVQSPCHEGGPWTFTKAQMPTPTPTSELSNGGGFAGG